MNKLFKKLGMVLALGIMTVSGLAFATPASAGCYYTFNHDGNNQLEDASGFIFQQSSPTFSYSWGSDCTSQPYFQGSESGVRTIKPQPESLTVKYATNSASSTDGIMVYLRYKNSSGSWVNVSHWGEQANTGGWVERIVQREYGDVPLNAYREYQLYFSNPDGASSFSVGFARPYHNYFVWADPADPLKRGYAHYH